MPCRPCAAARRRELLNYIVFLRVTPILPNTFINVASPIVGVPLAPFALGEPRWQACSSVGVIWERAGLHQYKLNAINIIAAICEKTSKDWGACYLCSLALSPS